MGSGQLQVLYGYVLAAPQLRLHLQGLLLPLMESTVHCSQTTRLLQTFNHYLLLSKWSGASRDRECISIHPTSNMKLLHMVLQGKYATRHYCEILSTKAYTLASGIPSDRPQNNITAQTKRTLLPVSRRCDNLGRRGSHRTRVHKVQLPVITAAGARWLQPTQATICMP